MSMKQKSLSLRKLTANMQLHFTGALHLAIKLAGEKLYGQAKPNCGTLQGHKVFCSDMTFDLV